VRSAEEIGEVQKNRERVASRRGGALLDINDLPMGAEAPPEGS